MKLRYLLAVLGILSSSPAVADNQAALAAAQARFPATDVRGATSTPIPGIYEFNMGGETVYGDVSARFLLLGKLVDMENLPQPPTYAELAANSLELQSGDLGEVLLFSDPQCPYCAALEEQLVNGELDGYRVRLILAPLIAGSHHLATQLLCQPEPARAYRQALIAGVAPLPCTGGQLDLHLAAVKAAGIVATPTLLAPTGARQEGIRPPGQLRAWVAAQQLPQ